MLHASFPRSVALTQLRFTSFAVTNLRRDLHTQECAHAGRTPIGDSFRHLVLGLSRPISDTGLTWTVQGIIGGDNRFGVNQVSKLVGVISYGF